MSSAGRLRNWILERRHGFRSDSGIGENCGDVEMAARDGGWGVVCRCRGVDDDGVGGGGDNIDLDLYPDAMAVEIFVGTNERTRANDRSRNRKRCNDCGGFFSLKNISLQDF